MLQFVNKHYSEHKNKKKHPPVPMNPQKNITGKEKQKKETETETEKETKQGKKREKPSNIFKENT